MRFCSHVGLRRFGLSGLVRLGRGEELGRGLRQRDQLAGELAHVFDDPAPLSPDPVCVSVQILQPLLPRGRDLRSLLTGDLEPILGLGT
jgi:hypothetical protein